MNNYTYPFSGFIPVHPIDFNSSQASSTTIIQACARFFSVPYEQVMERTRKRPIMDAREVAMYLIKKIHPSIPLKYIGKGIFKDYDHTTVINSINRVKGFIDVEPGYSDKIDMIIQSL